MDKKKDNIKEFVIKIAPFIRILFQNWKKLLLINSIVAVLSATFLLLFVKNYYDSTVTIMPDYGGSISSLGGLGGLAAMAGINVGEIPPTEIYDNLLYSENVLSPVIYSKYKTMEFDNSVDLIEYYRIGLKTVKKDDPIELQERDKFLQMVQKFNKRLLTTSVDKKTTILTATVRTNEPALSAEISNNLLKSLDKYVRTKRKSNAKEQRIYIEERVKQVKDSLTIVENKLKILREQNKIINQSPQLLLEEVRLKRDLEIQQTIYIELIKQMELVKLEEIKDAPIINIREEPGNPIIKAGPKRSIYFILVLLFSITISSLWIIYLKEIKEYLQFIISEFYSK